MIYRRFACLLAGSFAPASITPSHIQMRRSFIRLLINTLAFTLLRRVNTHLIPICLHSIIYFCVEENVLLSIELCNASRLDNRERSSYYILQHIFISRLTRYQRGSKASTRATYNLVTLARFVYKPYPLVSTPVTRARA